MNNKKEKNMKKKQYVPPVTILYRVAMEKGIAETAAYQVDATIGALNWDTETIQHSVSRNDDGDIWLPF
jgi:hypothetical protein